MMALFFAQRYKSGTCLSTGEIETVTDQLGVRIKATNVASTIKSNLRYFTGTAVRKRGTRVPYKLNRTGTTAFEKLLTGESL